MLYNFILNVNERVNHFTWPYVPVSHFSKMLLARGQQAIGNVEFSWKSDFSLQNLC